MQFISNENRTVADVDDFTVGNLSVQNIVYTPFSSTSNFITLLSSQACPLTWTGGGTFGGAVSGATSITVNFMRLGNTVFAEMPSTIAVVAGALIPALTVNVPSSMACPTTAAFCPCVVYLSPDFYSSYFKVLTTLAQVLLFTGPSSTPWSGGGFPIGPPSTGFTRQVITWPAV